MRGQNEKEPVERFQDFSSSLTMKEDQEKKPLWVGEDNHIFLECFHPLGKHASDFLIAIAEPLSRPTYVHEYLITDFSLYAAVSIGLKKEDILAVLENLSKNKIPESVKWYIREYTSQYGKVKLILKRKRYYLESDYRKVLEELMKIEIINEARIMGEMNLRKEDLGMEKEEKEQGDIKEIMDNEREEIKEEVKDWHQSICIDSANIEKVKEAAFDNHCPLLEEYDFKVDDPNDTLKPVLNIELNSASGIRPYQEQCLSKMFSNGRARSGIIVLPCGAGKTLVGITAMVTIKRRSIVVCNGGLAVEQWRKEIVNWSNANATNLSIFKFVSKNRSPQPMFSSEIAGIVLTTYTMLGRTKPGIETKKIMDKIESVEWGLMILDEVQVAPALTFREIMSKIKSHCKLGLTATLVREDDKIKDLKFLVGPKLFEANWLELQNQGYLAKVQCIEIRCEMTPDFFEKYLVSREHQKKILYTANPTKFLALQICIRRHSAQGDKIIIFSDNLQCLNKYSKILDKPRIAGDVPEIKRMEILDKFQKSDDCNVIFLSRVGDTSLDIPNANVIIQISSHFGSRKQEAQRLGRILRPKRDTHSKYNAFFYTLVSKNTSEMYFSSKRQRFLMDQGYAFKVINKEDLDLKASKLGEYELKLGHIEEQRSWLQEVAPIDHIEEPDIQNEYFVQEYIEQFDSELDDDEDQTNEI